MKNEILSHLPGDFPWQVHWYDTAPSTNDLLKKWGKEGAVHGTAVIADRQTGGRGRLGRSFHSPAGCGIYLSVLLRPNCKATELMHLTCAAAATVCDAVEAVSGFRPGIKWINDLIAGGKKLGGILTELSLGVDGSVEYCVIGIGINCVKNPFPEELKDIAVSLEEASGLQVDRSRLIAMLLQELHTMSQALLTDKAARMAQYRRDCITLGKEIQVIRNGVHLPAVAEDLDDDGGLLVRYSDGHRETVSSGEVSVRGMYGYI